MEKKIRKVTPALIGITLIIIIIAGITSACDLVGKPSPTEYEKKILNKWAWIQDKCLEENVSERIEKLYSLADEAKIPLDSLEITEEKIAECRKNGYISEGYRWIKIATTKCGDEDVSEEYWKILSYADSAGVPIESLGTSEEHLDKLLDLSCKNSDPLIKDIRDSLRVVRDEWDWRDVQPAIDYIRREIKDRQIQITDVDPLACTNELIYLEQRNKESLR